MGRIQIKMEISDYLRFFAELLVTRMPVLRLSDGK